MAPFRTWCVRLVAVPLLAAVSGSADAREFKVQRGFVTINGDPNGPAADQGGPVGDGEATDAGGIVTVDVTAVADLTRAFVRVTNSAHTGAGDNSGGGVQNAANVTAWVRFGTAADGFTATNKLTIKRFESTPSATDNTRVCWEIVEYTGLVGGANEFVVREQGVVLFVAGNTTFVEGIPGVANTNPNPGSEVVGFVTGIASPDGGTGDYEALQVTTSFADPNLTFTRGSVGGGGGDAIEVSYAAVEFVGTNWKIQRVQHSPYLSDTGPESEPIAPVAVSRTFLHVQKRTANNSNTLRDFGHQVWLDPADPSNVRFQVRSGAVVADMTSVAWVIENTQATGSPLNVIRGSGTLSNTALPDPGSTAVAYGPSGDVTLGNSSLFWSNDCANGTTNYPGPFVAVRLTSNSNIEAWQSDHDYGDVSYRFEVVEWPSEFAGDFRVQRGCTTLSSSTAVLTGGVDFNPPSSLSKAFVRITNSDPTGAGRLSGGGTQDADDVTAWIRFGSAADGYTATDKITIKRFGGSSGSVFRVQRGVVNINGVVDAGETSEATDGTGAWVIVTLPTPVASLNSAFVRITNSHHTGAGDDNNGGAAQIANRVTAWVQFDSVSQIRIKRKENTPSGTDNTRVCWEVVEYTGPGGGANEFIVQEQGVRTFVAANLTFSEPTTLAAGAKAVPFVTGEANPDGGTSSYLSGQITTAFDNDGADADPYPDAANPNIVFTRGYAGDGGGDAVEVSYALVEFTGANWIIQRAEHAYAAAGATENAAIAAVGSMNKAFLHAQKRIANNQDNADDFGHQVWLSAAGTVSFRLRAGVSSPGDHTSVAWVIENTDAGQTALYVQRGNGALAAGGSEPKTTNLSYGPIGDLSVASLFWNNDVDQTGEDFPTPMAAVRLTSTSNIEVWQSELSNVDVDYRWEVVEWQTFENTDVCWEIVEYTGPAGGQNELIVRKQGVFTFAATGTSETLALGPGEQLATLADGVCFVTGVANPDVGSADYETGLVTTEFDDASTVRFRRGWHGNDAVEVSYAVVEFTAAAWIVQRWEHTYAAAGATETQAIAAVNSLTRAFVYAQKRVGGGLDGTDGVDEHGHQVWLSLTNQLSFRLPAGASNPGRQTSVAWVIENTQVNCTPMVVWRGNGTLAAAGGGPGGTNLSIGPLGGPLETASVFWNNDSSGTGTTFPHPMVAVRLLSAATLETWRSDRTQSQDYRYEVVEWPNSGRTITGRIYTNEAKTADVGAGVTVALSVNGSLPVTVATAAGGNFTFLSTCLSSDSVIVIYIDNDLVYKASLVTISSAVSVLTGLEMYTGKVVLTHHADVQIDNVDLDNIDGVDAGDDDGITVAGGAATFAPGFGVWVESGKVYRPGGAVTAQDLDVRGTFDPAGNAVTLSGNLLITPSGVFTTTGNVTLNGAGPAVVDIENGTAANCDFQNLTLGGGATVEVYENSLGNFVVNGTLTLNSGSVLRIQGAETCNIGTLAAGGAAKPVITRTAGGGGFVFNVANALNVTGLQFSYADANGLQFTGTGDASTQRLDNVDFSNALAGGNHLSVNTTSLSLPMGGTTSFDGNVTGNFTGSVSVRANDTNGGNDVRVFVAMGDSANLAFYEGKEQEVNTGRVDWGIAYTRVVEPADAGSESGNADAAGVQGTFSLTFNTAPGVGSPKITSMWPMGPRGYYLAGRGTGGSPKDDQLVCMELADSGTIAKVLATYTISNASYGEVVGPPVALILAPNANTPNSSGGNADTDAASVNQVEDVFFGTTLGYVFRVRFDPGPTMGNRLLLCDTARGTGAAFPGLVVLDGALAGHTFVEVTSPMQADVFAPTRLYLGGRTTTAGPVSHYYVMGIGMDTRAVLTAPFLYRSSDLTKAVRAPFALIGGTNTQSFAGTDGNSTPSGGVMFRADTGASFTPGTSFQPANSTAAAHNFRGPITVAWGGDRVYAGNLNGRVYARKNTDLSRITGWPDDLGYGTGGSAVGGGIALGWDNTVGSRGWSPDTGLFFGDDAGKFYSVSAFTGADLASSPSFTPVSPRGAAAMRSYPLEGSVGAGDGSYFYVGNNDGILFWINKFAPDATGAGSGVYKDFGGGKRVRDISTAFGRLYAPTDKGEVFVVPARP